MRVWPALSSSKEGSTRNEPAITESYAFSGNYILSSSCRLHNDLLVGPSVLMLGFRALLDAFPKMPEPVDIPILASYRETEYWRTVIRRALRNCSTIDYYSISDDGIDNIALVAALAVTDELK